MPSRSGNHQSRYDDPYIFDDPYRHSSSPIRNAGYEYVGTDEPPNPPKSRRAPSPDLEPRRRPSPSRRYSRTTSPPRHSRYDRAYSPPSKSDRRSPPKASRDVSPPRNSKKVHRSRHNKDQDSPQRPGVKHSKSFGQQGLKFLGEAAALYAATQAGGRGRSQSRDDSYRSSHHSAEPRRHRHHHRHSPSPSPRRRSRAYSDDPPRRRHRRRSPSVSDDSDYDRNRGRHHRRSRASSYTESPSPRRDRHRKAASTGGRSRGHDSSSRAAKEAAADRWQMAARAALEAGGLTAFRLRKEPGKWSGEKGAKVATAALGAAAIDAFVDKDPRRTKSSGVKGFAENTISSLIASKIMGFKGPTTRGGRSRY
ncbi:uncharacterized protein F4822DRAFT_191438 [Hypoxylon trugodes]|uniref:uncharacterized protein n=1 Tax=Hypoxylon trugodes TaxID=326681 RepID=UPI002192E214|nr:uncharacterized protein F4822DRAFT_191438 [Hypoxylon trugodes]KAI1391622.1 hypothetical protein F4822DRAFT_191438 [Hypoxylon trugodes]